MNKKLDTVFLEGIELFGFIGVLEDEKRNGQTFYIDVELGVDLRKAGRSDILAQTVNYAEVFALAEQLMDEARCDLIESYAEQLSEEIFSYFDLVQEVSVTVRKPEAPIDGKFRAVGITIRRERDE
ncbi:dihydroneopterin aldolase [Pelagicoccus sp. NFK12]|uniref:7,8-dihydroneopterin aldolase n=1 Tax=Pelagicoccus enzymogenes TaxID=2773457 RepID=A0A927FAD3_9BACT|nr:dihydroneopterin aldolase [Pelagicoccus enzymogenes]MBD5781433.1 dihydroneopterin aldolase [Pelagicoccus enzymogenes]MDQ8199207.1 dihydroneopterin aldolase [Pelagicoccus enzymogenes]